MERTRRLIVAAALAGGSLLLMTSGALASGGDSHGGRSAPATQTSTAQSQPTGSTCDVPGRACDPSKTDHDNGVGNNCDPGYGRGNQAKFPSDEATTSCRTSGAGSRRESENTRPSGENAGEVGPATLEKVTAREEARTVTLTLVVTVNGETKTVVVTLNRGESAPMSITVNGEQLSGQSLGALLGGELVITPVAGGFTITLPTGMVLALNGNSLLLAGTAVAPGTTTHSGGVEVTNATRPGTTTAPAALTLPAGSVLGTSAASGLAANAATAASGAVSAAQGMPLAATGLPLAAGLLGLLLFGTGFVARRRR